MYTFIFHEQVSFKEKYQNNIFYKKKQQVGSVEDEVKAHLMRFIKFYLKPVSHHL
jgi:hypothetical protein